MEPNKVFRVDKKIVVKSTLPWAVTISVALLLLMHNFRVGVTIKNEQYWIFIAVLWVAKFILDIWTIKYDRTEFNGSLLTSYFNGRKSVDVSDFTSVKQKKTIYTNYLGFEYKEPKGIFVRFLFPYGLYSANTLKEIMQEILRINPNIRFEDDLSKQIAEGTYKSKILG